MPDYKTPGVHLEEIFPQPAVALRTGVPAFLGYTGKTPKTAGPSPLTLWLQFVENFVDPVDGDPVEDGYLAEAVRGFFENGGELCYVAPLEKSIPPVEALQRGLEEIASLDMVDLVCAPDVMMYPAQQAVQLQKMILEHCDGCGDRFALLDALPPKANETPVASLARVLEQRKSLSSSAGALYYPWVRANAYGAQGKPAAAFLPPCGHVAGIYARSDLQFGVHKAPANEILRSILDLSVRLTDAQQGSLNENGINCLRAFPGRGIRIWGARTLSSQPEWKYVNVRRLFLTVGRWIQRRMSGVAFEPNDPGLWARLERETGAYLDEFHQHGALHGRVPEESFYVKCDAETNPLEVRSLGRVVVEIGLAPSVPAEFVVVRIVHDSGGVTILGPQQPFL